MLGSNTNELHWVCVKRDYFPLKREQGGAYCTTKTMSWLHFLLRPYFTKTHPSVFGKVICSANIAGFCNLLLFLLRLFFFFFFFSYIISYFSWNVVSLVFFLNSFLICQKYFSELIQYFLIALTFYITFDYSSWVYISIPHTST